MDNSPDIRTYIGVIKRRLPLMLATFVAVACCGVAVAIVWPPVYRSQALLLVESQQIPDELVRATVRTIADERLQVIRQRVRTRDALLGIVEKFKLFRQERGSLTPTQIVERMRARSSIEKFELGGSKRSRRAAVTIGFTVAFEDRSPNTAHRVANELVTLILGADVKTRSNQASETTRFLQRETDERRRRLSKVAAKISAFKLKNVTSLPDKRRSLERQLENGRAQLQKLERSIVEFDEQLQLRKLELRVRRAAGNNSTGPFGAQSGSLRKLDALREELAAKRALYKDNHPDIRQLLGRIAALESVQPENDDVSENDGDVPKNQVQRATIEQQLVSTSISALEARKTQAENALKKVLQSLKKSQEIVEKIPGTEEVLNRFYGEQAAMQKELQDLEAKLNQAKLGERLERDRQAERIEVIEQPIRPTEPVRPNRPLILLGGFGAAAGAAFAIMLLLELLNRTVRSNVDIVRALEQPPLATIPFFATETERRRQKYHVILAIIMLAFLIVAALLLVQFFYLPLDEVFYKIMRRFSV